LSNTNPIDKEEKSIQSSFGLNNKVLLLIIGLALAFEFYVLTTEYDLSIFNVADSFYIIGPIVVMILGFVVAFKHGRDSMYFKPFLTLSLGLFFVLLGDTTYLYYDIVLGEDPYPSIADVFYFLFYPFTIGFIFLTLKFFAFPLSKPKVTLIAIITIGAIFVYTGLSYEAFEGDILNFDFAYGMIFVSAAALTAGLSTLGIISFKHSLQGLVWLLILGSLLVDSVANIWYYHLELFEGYVALDTIDTLILVTYMLMFYGLYRHYRYST
jgi:hypothetical protein